MRRLVATVLGGILLAAPAVMLACRWTCVEPAMVAEEGCHEPAAPAVGLTGATVCDEHPGSDNQGVPVPRTVLSLPALDTPVALPAQYAGVLASHSATGPAFSPPKPPLALRI